MRCKFQITSENTQAKQSGLNPHVNEANYSRQVPTTRTRFRAEPLRGKQEVRRGLYSDSGVVLLLASVIQMNNEIISMSDN